MIREAQDTIQKKKDSEWNPEEFKLLCKKAAENGILMGQRVNSLEDVYTVLAGECDLSKSAISNWTRPYSGGPRSAALRRRVKRALGKTDTDYIGDFVKKQLLDMYKLAHSYCTEAGSNNKDAIEKKATVLDECMDILKITVPDDVYRILNDEILQLKKMENSQKKQHLEEFGEHFLKPIFIYGYVHI